MINIIPWSFHVKLSLHWAWLWCRGMLDRPPPLSNVWSTCFGRGRGSQYTEEKLSVWMGRMRSGWGWICESCPGASLARVWLTWPKQDPKPQGKGHATEDSPLESECSGHPGDSVLGPDQAAKLSGCCFIGRAQWLAVREMWSASQFGSIKSRAKKRIT